MNILYRRIKTPVHELVEQSILQYGLPYTYHPGRYSNLGSSGKAFHKFSSEALKISSKVICTV